MSHLFKFEQIRVALDVQLTGHGPIVVNRTQVAPPLSLWDRVDLLQVFLLENLVLGELGAEHFTSNGIDFIKNFASVCLVNTIVVVRSKAEV